MSPEEVDAIVHTAKNNGRRLAAHAHADNPVLQRIEKEVEFVYRATYASDGTIEKLLDAKIGHYVTPAIAARYNTTYEAGDWGITVEIAEAIGTKREFEVGCETMAKMHKAGVKVLPFGDYGFAWTPHGTDARISSTTWALHPGKPCARRPLMAARPGPERRARSSGR